MKKMWNVFGYILIGALLYIVSVMNLQSLVFLDFSNIYVIIFILYLIGSGVLSMIEYKKRVIFSKELHYIIQFVFFFCVLLIPGIIINNNFILEHIGESNLYLRSYGKVAMGYFAMALVISPLLQFIKNPKIKLQLIFSRKILGILTFIFFLKHGLEYFAVEYVYQTEYHMDTPYLSYVLDNLLVRFDALSGVIVGILMFILGITSNKFSIRFLGKKWKKVQSLVFPTFVFSAVHVAFSSRFDEFYIFLILMVVISRLAAYLNRKERRSSGKIIGYRCIPCGYIYDEKIGDLDSGIVPGTKFEDIPNDWSCPVCGVTKDDFEPIYEGEDTLLDAKVVGYTMLTSDVVELSLQIPSLKKINVQAGQFANIGYTDNNGSFFRSYSVVDKKKNILTFAIKLKQGGRGSEILKNMAVGNSIKFGGIYGKFLLQNTKNPKVFIASGTGLSPIMYMLKKLKKKNNITLLFSVAYQKDIFYQKELESMDGLDLKIFLSRENKNGYQNGRIDISKYTFSKDTEFYICGNPGLVLGTKEKLNELGYNFIFSEEF